jgi:hypothetical protein
MGPYYCAYAYVHAQEDGGIEVSFLSASFGFPDDVLERAARTLVISGRAGRAYWVIHQPGVDPKLWIRPYKPRPPRPRRFYTVPGTGRVLEDES